MVLFFRAMPQAWLLAGVSSSRHGVETPVLIWVPAPRCFTAQPLSPPIQPQINHILWVLGWGCLCPLQSFSGKIGLRQL